MSKVTKKSRKKTVPAASKDVLRKAILARAKDLKLTGYHLTKALKGRVSRTSVYRFLNEGGSTNTETIEAFFDYLGLEVVPAKKK